MSASRPRGTGWLRVAAWLLGLIGAANAGVATLALLSGPDVLATGVAVGLLAAGSITIALAVAVGREHRVATYVALVTFELLLVARLVALDEISGAEVVSVVALVLVVATLFAGTRQLRRDRPD